MSRHARSMAAGVLGLVLTAASTPQKPKDFPMFFANASVDLLAKELAQGETLGNASQDDMGFDGHHRWAMQTASLSVLVDLMGKFDRMALIKLARGRPALADWYAKVCVTWAEMGLDFGSREANSVDRGTHYHWASSTTTGISAVQKELKTRLAIIYGDYHQIDRDWLSSSDPFASFFDKLHPGGYDENDDLARALAAALKNGGFAFPMPDGVGAPLGAVGDPTTERPWEPPAPGVAKIKEVRVDPKYQFEPIVSGAKLFILGWNLGTRPGRVWIAFEKPVGDRVSIDLEPFDSRGWKACWFDEAILARMPDIGEIEKNHGYLIVELPNGQKVRDFVFLGRR